MQLFCYHHDRTTKRQHFCVDPVARRASGRPPGPDFGPKICIFLRYAYITPIFWVGRTRLNGIISYANFETNDLVYDFSFPSYARFREGTRPMPQKVFPHPTVRAPSASKERCQRKKRDYVGKIPKLTGGVWPKPTSWCLLTKLFLACQNDSEVLKHVLQKGGRWYLINFNT